MFVKVYGVQNERKSKLKPQIICLYIYIYFDELYIFVLE